MLIIRLEIYLVHINKHAFLFFSFLFSFLLLCSVFCTDPDFMLFSCAESCAKMSEGSGIKSLYDIVETDIHGKDLPFSNYKGSILYIVNVASHCGYTAENYEMFRHLAKYRDEGVYTILAPCNQVRFCCYYRIWLDTMNSPILRFSDDSISSISSVVKSLAMRPQF